MPNQQRRFAAAFLALALTISACDALPTDLPPLPSDFTLPGDLPSLPAELPPLPSCVPGGIPLPSEISDLLKTCEPDRPTRGTDRRADDGADTGTDDGADARAHRRTDDGPDHCADRRTDRRTDRGADRPTDDQAQSHADGPAHTDADDEAEPDAEPVPNALALAQPDTQPVAVTESGGRSAGGLLCQLDRRRPAPPGRLREPLERFTQRSTLDVRRRPHLVRRPPHARVPGGWPLHGDAHHRRRRGD